MLQVLKPLELKRAKSANKPYKLADGGGLYILINSAGKYWRYDYRFNGKRKTLALGVYPTMGLQEARLAHQAAKNDLDVLLIDPITTRSKSARRKAATTAANSTLKSIGMEWLDRKSADWAETHTVKVKLRLENDVYPYLGSREINSIRVTEILECLQRVEARGAVDSAHRIKQTLGQIFRYAIASDRATSDPTVALRGALTSVSKQSYPHITDPARLGEVLKAIDDYQGSYAVKCALQVLPLVFVRPGELRNASWDEFDFDRAVWIIPAGRMKRKNNGNHIVPLSTQALRVLKDLKLLTGAGELLFPGQRSTTRPISDNSLNAGLRRMDISKEEHVCHGFRHTASTLLNEAKGFDPDIIEVQLHHADRSVRGKYNKADYFELRVRMMQEWADYLDGLKLGANIAKLAGA